MEKKDQILSDEAIEQVKKYDAYLKTVVEFQKLAVFNVFVLGLGFSIGVILVGLISMFCAK